MDDPVLVDAVARRLYVEGGGAAEPSVWSGPTWDVLPDSPVRRDCLVRAVWLLRWVDALNHPGGEHD